MCLAKCRLEIVLKYLETKQKNDGFEQIVDYWFGRKMMGMSKCRFGFI